VDLIAAIGPAIGPCCYEVSQDVAARFQDFLPEWSGAGKTHLDLVRVNQWQLQAAGVPPGAMDVLDACTRCEADLFHSFRRDAEASGRMHAVIGLLS
jgi:copper oxidase (laccase) domain-containing protein